MEQSSEIEVLCRDFSIFFTCSSFQLGVWNTQRFLSSTFPLSHFAFFSLSLLNFLFLFLFDLPLLLQCSHTYTNDCAISHTMYTCIYWAENHICLSERTQISPNLSHKSLIHWGFPVFFIMTTCNGYGFLESKCLFHRLFPERNQKGWERKSLCVWERMKMLKNNFFFPSDAPPLGSWQRIWRMCACSNQAWCWRVSQRCKEWERVW